MSVNKRRILAVDDNPDILETVETYLMGCDYEVETAESAPEALGKMRSGFVPSILFSDIVMPGAIDGIELAKEVQRSHPHVGILLMTGWSYDDQHGFPVLIKPFQLEDITNWFDSFFRQQ